MSKITNPKAIQAKSKSHVVTPQGGDVFTVESGASRNTYTVNVYEHGATCTCDWAKYRPASDTRSGCSHVVSVFNFIAEGAGRKVSAWSSVEDAKRQHRPTLDIGDGVTITARLKSAPILWVIQSETVREEVEV